MFLSFIVVGSFDLLKGKKTGKTSSSHTVSLIWTN